MPTPGRDHWTCGIYAHSRLRAMDMFRSPGPEQWTCPAVPPAKSGHAQRKSGHVLCALEIPSGQLAGQNF